MKKIILSIAVLTAFATTSCKKAYECTCETTQSTVYTAVFSDYDAMADAYNDAEADGIPNKSTSVTTLDKTSKSAANAGCTDDETTDSFTEDYDNLDADNDDNYSEAGVTAVTTYKTDCSLEKK